MVLWKFFGRSLLRADPSFRRERERIGRPAMKRRRNNIWDPLTPRRLGLYLTVPDTAWAIRFKQFAKRIWTLRKGKHWIANSFFTLWVSTDVLALIKGTAPPLPLSVWGAVFGGLLVSYEWLILVEEFRQSAPLHVLWQPSSAAPVALGLGFSTPNLVVPRRSR